MMLAAEVMPYLILAIGSDNMFLIVRAEKEIPHKVTAIDERIGYAMKNIGPSILTAMVCESTAFFIGLLTNVPSLANFCLVAGLGVIINFLLQMTIFVGALAIDIKRTEKGHGDLIIACLKLENAKNKPQRREWCQPRFKYHIAPIIFSKLAQVAITLITICLLTIGGMSIFRYQLGLSDRFTLVDGSDSYDYYTTN